MFIHIFVAIYHYILSYIQILWIFINLILVIALLKASRKRHMYQEPQKYYEISDLYNNLHQISLCIQLDITTHFFGWFLIKPIYFLKLLIVDLFAKYLPFI